MKKAIISILIVSLLMVSLSGCFGSFSLTRKVYDLNKSVGDKFVQSLVMWVLMIIPVYGFASFVDVVILNLIEFWSGANPLAMDEGEMEQRIYVHEDRTYEVTTMRNRYDIREIDNALNSFSLVFEENESSWYLHSQGQIFRLTEESVNGTRLYDFDGGLLAGL